MEGARGKQRNPGEPEEGAEKKGEPGSLGSKESLESEGNRGSRESLRSEARLRSKESMGMGSLESEQGNSVFFFSSHPKIPETHCL